MVAVERGNKKAKGNDEWNGRDPTVYNEEETDRILSEGLLRLSFRERNNVNEEIHGVRDAFPEWKERTEPMELSLLDMELELESILLEKSNYDCGLRLHHIPANRQLRQAFLRCELYDVKKAAQRLVIYVRFIRGICACGGGVAGCTCGSFGNGENHGRIQASKWFTPKEYSALKSGVIQLMPYRDRSGRRVLIVFSACFRVSITTRVKIIIYLTTGASEDVESQKRGFVILVWPGMCDSVKPSKVGILPSVDNRRKAMEVQNALPMRFVCMHFGFADSPLMKVVKIVLVSFMIRNYRQRFNLITGTKMELGYKIMGFGIHPSMIPLTDGGTVRTTNHFQWLEARECIESCPYGSFQTDAVGRVTVECPGINDVLFNRGKSCQFHPGNATFKGMLEAKKNQHLVANQMEKKKLAAEIMEEVVSRNGRFLYWEKPGWWVKIGSRVEARRKVATALRDFNKNLRAAENRQKTQSSTHIFSEESRKRKQGSPNYNSASDCSCLGFQNQRSGRDNAVYRNSSM